MEDEDLDARIAAKHATKKKKKKKPTASDGGGAGEVGADGEVVRKKKKKKKPSASTSGDALDADGGGEGGGGGGTKKKRKKKKKPVIDDADDGGGGVAAASAVINGSDDGDEQGFATAAVATATVGAAAATMMDNNDDDAMLKTGYNDDDIHDEDGLEMVRQSDRQSDKFNDDSNRDNGSGAEDDDENGGDGMYAGANIIEADTEIMAEINNEGVVQVDESGGIQAFVAETIAIDGDDVGIIRSDAEIEKEEKKKYTKYFCGAVACLVVVIVAVAVPVTLKFAKVGQKKRITQVTDSPTSYPSSMPSEIPSSQPSSYRFTQIVKMLEPLSGDALYVQGSPQYLAAMWMADSDPIQNYATGGTGLDLDDPGFTQRYIMAVFYYAMDGPNWTQSQGWLGEESECLWFGVDGASEGCGGEGKGGCIARTDFVGSYDQVCRIGMGRHNNLLGQIPSEMGQLAEMRWFEVQDDYLIGTLPHEIGGWTKLHTMLLGGNFIGGGFPDTFEDNEFLGTIFIDRNQFNGTFPDVFTTLTNLAWLDAENNTFVGTMSDDISKLRKLRQLNVNSNLLTGTLPDSWDETNAIEDFEVANNTFRGPLPPTLGKVRFLKDLRASRNELTGMIPVEYYAMSNLEELYLDGNLLGGELPQTDEPFYFGLQELGLHGNKEITGRFPVEHFEDTLRIKVLSLHDTDLSGQISPNICDRRDSSLAWSQLEVLTANCDKITCNCCDCYVDGQLQSWAGI